MSKQLKPLHDRVVLRRIEEEETLKSGLFIPDNAKEKQQEGEVLAVGSGRIVRDEIRPLEVKVGDRVLFGKYAGTEVKVNFEDLLIVREDEIFAVVQTVTA